MIFGNLCVRNQVLSPWQQGVLECLSFFVLTITLAFPFYHSFASNTLHTPALEALARRLLHSCAIGTQDRYQLTLPL